MSTGVITQLNRGRKVSMPAGAVRHSTLKPAGCRLAELPAGSWVAAGVGAGARAAPQVASWRKVRRLVTMEWILLGYDTEARAHLQSGGSKNVIRTGNVVINTTMWNFGLHIWNGKCYLYTNWSFTCEYTVGPRFTDQGVPRTGTERFRKGCFVRSFRPPFRKGER